jgi:competence protein ComEA
MCQTCHGLDSITQKRRTPDEWQIAVEQMISNGAPLLPKEADIIVQYLCEHFTPTTGSSSSPESTGKTPIPVNTAAAKDLQSALGLSAKEVAAIVDYREKHGSFRAWEDLQKVPDLDVKKIEPLKDRLVY